MKNTDVLQSISMKKIYIVIAVFKRLELTKNCLYSLAQQSYTNFKVVVVNHCVADDNTVNFVASLDHRFVLIKGDDTMWWTEATNHGIRHIQNEFDGVKDDDFILTLNNDLTVGPEYLQELIETYEMHKPCLVGSVSVDADNPQRIDFAGCKWDKWTTRMPDVFAKKTKYDEIKSLEFIKTDFLPGRGMLIPMEVFKKIGLFDTKNFPHYGSDYDFSYSANKAGYRLIINPRALVKSVVGETGARFDKNSQTTPSLAFFLETQRSIKSPMNVVNRWNWAKKNVKASSLYFIIDTMRIIVSYSIYTVKFYLKRKKKKNDARQKSKALNSA